MMTFTSSSRSLLLVVFAGAACSSLVSAQEAAAETIDLLEEKHGNQRVRLVRTARTAAELETNAVAVEATGGSHQTRPSGLPKHAIDDKQDVQTLGRAESLHRRRGPSANSVMGPDDSPEEVEAEDQAIDIEDQMEHQADADTIEEGGFDPRDPAARMAADQEAREEAQAAEDKQESLPGMPLPPPRAQARDDLAEEEGSQLQKKAKAVNSHAAHGDEPSSEDTRDEDCPLLAPTADDTCNDPYQESPVYAPRDTCLYTIKPGLASTQVGSDRFCTTICESGGVQRIKCQGDQASDVVAKFRFYDADGFGNQKTEAARVSRAFDLDLDFDKQSTDTPGKYQVQAHDGHFCKVDKNNGYKVACNKRCQAEASTFTLSAVGGHVFRLKFEDNFCHVTYSNHQTGTYFMCDPTEQLIADDDANMFIQTYIGQDDAGPSCPTTSS